MSRRTISDAEKLKLVEHFRSDAAPGSPGSFTRAAAATGLDRRTCKRAWFAGWPGFRAVAQTIEVERTLSRASLRREVLQQRLDDATRLAMEDAAEERARGGQTVRVIAMSARNALAALHMEKIHDYQRTLARLMQNENPADERAVSARKAFKDITDIVRGLAEAADRAQVMEARLLGQPTVILGGEVGVKPVAPVTADVATLVAEVEAAQRALEELKALEAKKAPDGNGSAIPN